MAHIPQVCGAPASFVRRRLCVLSAEATAHVQRRGAPCQTIARLLEHRRGRGSSRLKVGALRAGQSAGSQASLRVPSTGIGRAESIPEGGL